MTASDDDLDLFDVPEPKVDVANKVAEKLSRMKAKRVQVKPAEEKKLRDRHSKIDDDEDEDNSDIIIRHPQNAKTRKLMEKSGAPRSAFLRAGSKIILDESVQPILADLSKTKVRKVSAAKQLKTFEKIQENPLRGSYLYVISSYPSDLRAKQVALSIMANATRQFYERKTSNRTLLKKSPPVWHNVLGGFRDSLLDRDALTAQPSMLILSNVTEDASQHKLEKLRDILVTYESIPVIVVTSAIDPVSFMLGKLKHHGDGFLYLGPDDKDTLNNPT